MKTRKLGNGGLEVSETGLGCMGMSMAYGSRDDAESVLTIERALDIGVTFIDSADMYGQGPNEELIGEVLGTRRNEAVLATKFGNVRHADGSRSVNGRPDYVPLACEASLRRLNTEAIDLYYLHRVDPDTPIEETVGAMARLVDAGKVRFLGLSEAGPETIRRACSVHPIAALQSEYSLWSRDVEDAILPTCRELGVGFVAYAPLGRGFLTGAIASSADLPKGDRRHDHPRFTDEAVEKNQALLPVLRRLAEAHGVTPAQVALAWLLARGGDVVPIAGTKKRKWLEENAAAAEFGLPDTAIAELDAAFPPGVAHGSRYPAKQMASLGRDS
jgi:aryl-alcohol dehydrogenase-like predicted oxidoreductase